MTALLEARQVTKVFGGGVFSKKNVNVALEDFSLSIENSPPSITAVVGESGSGKTTLARLLLGLAEPTTGAVWYKGQDVAKLRGAARRAFLRDIQVIFQDPYEVYNPFYKVDHVLETPVAKFGLAKTREQARALIIETLNAVGLRPDETLGRYPHQLSGGQRQRVMVARALLLRPSLIIADEPVSMVDASLRATILDSLRRLHEQFGISLIYITHDLTTAYQISHNIIVLYRGSVAEAGDVEMVVKEPQHPYTQLLIGSIPFPDPDHTWQEDFAPDPSTAATQAVGEVGGKHGCRFAGRCPHVMDICHQSPPPLFRTSHARAAACFLYRDAPTLETGALNEVLIEEAPAKVS